MNIEPTPDMPNELRNLAESGKLVLFVGAGVSRLAGCPNWNDFADASLKHFLKHGELNHGRLSQLSELSPRLKLSLACGLQKKTKNPIGFKDILHPTEPDQVPEGKKIYGYLSALGSTFVTTNYDKWLDVAFAKPNEPDLKGEELAQKPSAKPKERTVIYDKKQFTWDHLNPDTVIHLHGSIEQPDTMVMSTIDYIEHYRMTEEAPNPVRSFLKSLFSLRSVLFIGYGLDEPEILDYILLETPKIPEGGKSVKHYMLQGFYTHEAQLAQSYADYFEEFGIQLIPFSKDDNDYAQLNEVIKKWSEEATINAPGQATKLLDMKALYDRAK